MIRFIDLRGQILPGDNSCHFAFFDTIPDQFINLDGYEDWTSWESFAENWENEKQDKHSLERFKNLCADWVFEAQNDGEKGR